ncbi:MAG: hypothetical protein JRI22_21290 [Deltaproteobacteria bacterium]|nr:hypothetical protein [Deltaproteobacteria bacterium]
MKRKRTGRIQIPQGMRVQLACLFGDVSKEASSPERTEAGLQKTLRKILVELERYLDHNVQTDEVHRIMLQTGLWAARESLKQNGHECLLGYIEGIVRFALLLLGDYPNHRNRRPGARRSDHYRLNTCRSIVYSQSHSQKAKTLFAAKKFGLPELTRDPFELWLKFRAECKVEYRDFIRWYRKEFPEDYSAVL